MVQVRRVVSIIEIVAFGEGPYFRNAQDYCNMCAKSTQRRIEIST